MTPEEHFIRHLAVSICTSQEEFEPRLGTKSIIELSNNYYISCLWTSPMFDDISTEQKLRYLTDALKDCYKDEVG